MSKKRVAIICGGRSSEHSISCISAKGVLEAIDRNLFEPILIGITLRGKWVALKSADDFGVGSDGLPIIPDTAPGINADVHGLKNAEGAPLAIDLAFPLLHGAYGEDGTIQGLFEMADIPYVGSGVLASSVAMDKTFAKPIYADFGLAVADGITVHQRDWIAQRELEIAKIKALGLPVFVKPARSGSSRGTTKVKSDNFEAKYLDGSTTFDVPANVTPEIARAISDAAVTAFEALGCEGLARVDFFLTEENQVIINELNTMPGFTSMSVFPMLWKATGKSYSEIITQLCESALARPKNVIR